MRACIGDEPECNGPYCGHSENCPAYIEMSKEDSNHGCCPEGEHAKERKEDEMTLDEAIEHFQILSRQCGADHGNLQVAGWLVELKGYRMAGQDLDERPVTSMAMYRIHVASYRRRIKELNATVERLSHENAKLKEALYETERRS